MKEALLYEKLDDQKIKCCLCCHYCLIKNKGFGFCRARQNINGILYTRSYGRLIAACADPIEKKPLYHFLPGSSSFSIATAGCNFRCGFCQNWQISQRSFADEELGEEIAPAEIIKQARAAGCKSISYTYTEPTIFFEYALEIMKLAKERGLRNIFVTNGYMSPQAICILKDYLDAANIDLKFFSEDSYKKICLGSLQPVKDSIRLMQEAGIWIEVTTLIIPKENDTETELSAAARFIAGVSKDIPWHISRFHPDYEFSDRPATCEKTIKKALELAAAAGLNYVYAGNISGYGTDTYCPACKKILIKREGFTVKEYNLHQGNCKFCKYALSGIFN